VEMACSEFTISLVHYARPNALQQAA